MRSLVALLVICAVRADDDLVKSTIQEDQYEREDKSTEPETRQIRTQKSSHPLTDIPAPGDFAETRGHLVSHPNLNWRAGDEVTVVCHFTHRLAKPVNVTGLMGSLNNPVNFNYYLQNFTYDAENYAAAAKEDVTFDYTFTLKSTLDPGDWQVALTIYYSVGRMLFADTFFNETVTLTAPSSALSFVTLLVIIGLTAAAAYFGKDFIKDVDQPAIVTSADDKRSTEATTRSEDDDDWTSHLTAPGGGGKKKKSKATKRK